VKMRNLTTQLLNTGSRKHGTPFRRRGCMCWRGRIVVSRSHLYCYYCP